MRPARANEDALIVLFSLGPGRLVDSLFKRGAIDYNAKNGSETRTGREDLCGLSILLNGEQGHTATVNAPLVHLHGLELGGDAGVEYALPHAHRDTGTVVKEEESANTLLFRCCDIDPIGSSVTSVSEHLDNDILDTLNVVLSLTALSFGNSKLYVAVA